MAKMLINATQSHELRCVIIDGSGKLVNYDVDTPLEEQKKSNIYKAVVMSIEKSLGALFVNFGSERTGFLPFSNISPEYYNDEAPSGNNPDLHKLFRLGQEIVVQVEKDERGNKGAALTTYISLAGSYCVLMPNNARGGGISRQIEGKEREALQEKIEKLDVPAGMGVIVRTAGVNRGVEELNWDLKILLRYWDAIKQAAIAKPGPYLIHQESNVVLRSVRDNLREDIVEVIIDNQAAFQEVHDYVRLVRPDFLDRIKLHTGTSPLFSQYQVEGQIEMAYQHELELPSGGSIVIDHTEALVSIDVNSARATKGGNIEETALQTNLEAADEIARQLRIRDLGGLIVIDFIDMTPMQNRREVENRLRDALKIDRARIQMERISRFGLLEMSRQRLRRALSRSIKNTCPRCKGQGMIQSVESLASTIIHRIEQQVAKATAPLHFTIQAPLSLATYLVNERRANITDIESRHQTQITVIPNEHLETPEYTLKTADLTADMTHKIMSYERIKQVKSITPEKTEKQPTRTFDEPIMNQYLTIPDAMTGPSTQGSGTGLFKRLITRMFGDEKIAEAEPTPATSKPKKPADKSRSTTTPRRAPTGEKRHQSTTKDHNHDLPITSVTRKVEEKSSRPARLSPSKSDSNRTRRGNRGGSRTSTKTEGQTADSGNKTQNSFQAASSTSSESFQLEIPRPVPVPTQVVLSSDSADSSAVAKKQRRSLSSAKVPGASRSSSHATAAKKPTRPTTNPAKRIKPRETDGSDS